jgi:hypothetical protein
MAINIFRRYTSILSVYVGYRQHSKLTFRIVCFEKRTKYVNKSTCSMLQKITLNMSVFVIIDHITEHIV